MEVDGVHRSLPNVRHRFELTRGKDKLSLLKDILHASTGKNKNERILIFCNTVQSSRAVEYAINEDPAFHAVSYHGELNSREREKNLDDFRSGNEKLLVCTDLAARGLDIPDINHVVLFDFPLNPVDYLHRAGRCGRAGRSGKVTSLVSKRDEVLARAIELAIQRKEPIDALSSSKSAYAVTPTKTRKSFLEGVPRPRPKKTIIGSRFAPAGGRGGVRGGKLTTSGAKAGSRTERGRGGAAKFSSNRAGGPKRSDDVASPRVSSRRSDDSSAKFSSNRAGGSKRSDGDVSSRDSGARKSGSKFSVRGGTVGRSGGDRGSEERRGGRSVFSKQGNSSRSSSNRSGRK